MHVDSKNYNEHLRFIAFACRVVMLIDGQTHRVAPHQRSLDYDKRRPAEHFAERSSVTFPTTQEHGVLISMHNQSARRVRAKYPTAKIIEATLAAFDRCGVPLEACTYALSPDGQFSICPTGAGNAATVVNDWSAWEKSRGE